MGKVKTIVTKMFEFEAAHYLPEHSGKCSRIHGHSYKLEVSVIGKVNQDTGMIFDFEELSIMVNSLLNNLFDHYYLNDIIDNPTAENLVMLIGEQIKNEVSGYRDLKLHSLRLWETSKCSVYVEF
jgi:6-pyruvoyltetrahydropterin/6-carboxytetrahydropterin synthase